MWVVVTRVCTGTVCGAGEDEKVGTGRRGHRVWGRGRLPMQALDSQQRTLSREESVRRLVFRKCCRLLVSVQRLPLRFPFWSEEEQGDREGTLQVSLFRKVNFLRHRPPAFTNVSSAGIGGMVPSLREAGQWSV